MEIVFQIESSTTFNSYIQGIMKFRLTYLVHFYLCSIEGVGGEEPNMSVLANINLASRILP